MKIVSVMTGGGAGGAEYAAVALLDSLVARGHQAVLLADDTAIGRGTAVTVRELDLGPKLSRRSYGSLAARLPALRRRLYAALDAEAPYDVLLLHFKKEQLMALGLPRRLRPRLAWSEWGPVPFPLRKGPGGAVYRRAAASVDVVLCVSEGTRLSVIAAGVPAQRAYVLANVVDAAVVGARPGARDVVRGRLGIPPDAFVVGCMSRFNHKKRNDVLVEAVTALDDPRVHLVMAGEGETEADLRALAAALGPRAHFVPTPGDSASELLSAWDLAAFCPSPTEGAPLAIIVSMLCGLPVVSTGAEGALGLVEPGAGAIAAPDHDVAASAALLRAYVADPERCRREGAEARRRAAIAHDAAEVAARAEALLQG